jgi:hypothetical protein
MYCFCVNVYYCHQVSTHYHHIIIYCRFFTEITTDGWVTARTAQLTHSVWVIKANQLTLCREIITICSEIHKKHAKHNV